MKTFRWLTLGAVVLSAVAAFTQASSNVTVFATGFNNPRGLKWGADGNLYVAEAGTGGHNSTIGQCDQVVPPIGPYTGGSTARISEVTPDGTRSTFARNLSSSRDAVGDVLGVADVAFVGTQLYAVTAAGGCSYAHPNFPNPMLQINADGSWSRLANLSAFQMAHPVANPNPPDFEPDGVWYNLISVDSNLFAVEPNHGRLTKLPRKGS